MHIELFGVKQSRMEKSNLYEEEIRIEEIRNNDDYHK